MAKDIWGQYGKGYIFTQLFFLTVGLTCCKFVPLIMIVVEIGKENVSVIIATVAT